MIYHHTEASMYGLYISLAALGLSAIDPIGIGIMPILLIQKHPYKRVAIFLSGSFLSLIIMGLLFARGLGNVVLRFEHRHSWFVPSVEIIAAVILLIIAITVYVRSRSGKTAIEPSQKTRTWLQLGNWQLFLCGALLVALQSIIDVVFVIAMIRVGQFKLSSFGLVMAVATYAIAALVLQIAVIVVFRFAPQREKTKTLEYVQHLLIKYSNQALITISVVLSLILLLLAI
jgi:hypothetical protein